MTVSVIDLTPEQLSKSRSDLLRELHLTEAELRERVGSETATKAEQEALERLDEIAFLLGEDE